MWPSSLEQPVEDALVLEALLLVDRVDARAHRFPRQVEPGVDHAVDGRGDRVRLHLHEVDQRIVEVEYDRADHAERLTRVSAGDVAAA